MYQLTGTQSYHDTFAGENFLKFPNFVENQSCQITSGRPLNSGFAASVIFQWYYGGLYSGFIFTGLAL